ncbi:hypothetical protein HYU09_01685 [Candidatus Woesearchaeota archaeon]|nr:hypothetical protein [Candidatus Woesearchaeota archaeon]
MAAKKKDTHSYKGWLNSDNFLKRAFAVLGYSSVATLIIYIPFLILMIIFAFFVLPPLE